MQNYDHFLKFLILRYYTWLSSFFTWGEAKEKHYSPWTISHVVKSLKQYQVLHTI